MAPGDTIKELTVVVQRCPECGTGFGLDAAFCPFDGVALQPGTWDPNVDPLTDTVVDRRYEVKAPLGEGGMGTVYKVRHTTLDRMFAMKVLRRDLAADSGLAERFVQEARATAAIRHPHVVSINDFGELDDGTPYFVMELLAGETLATRLRARGPLPPREAAAIARRIADGLAAAHSAGVVHRDLKPENIFLVGASGAKGSPDDLRIVDFGAAKVVGASKLTRPGIVFGTPYYMSPEQAGGQPVDARADVYSLGVLLFEMTSGVLPFEADTYMGVLTKHLFSPPPRLRDKAAGAALGKLDEVVMRALEKEPGDRYATMAEMGAALAEAFDGPSAARGSTARRTPSFESSAMSSADRIERSVSRRLDGERRRQLVVVVGVSCAATLCACAVAMAFFSTPTPRVGAQTGQLSLSLTSSPASPAASPPASVAPTAPPEPSTPPIVPAVSLAPPALATGQTSPAPRSGSPPAPRARAGGPEAIPAPPPRPATARDAPAHRPSDELIDPWRR